MSSRPRAASALCVSAGSCALAEAVWATAFLGRSSDGPAFAMVLVTVVLLPTLLVATGAVLIEGVPRRTRITATVAVAASGLAAAGVEAGVFIGDDPADPAFIHWAAAMPWFAFLAAVPLAGSAAWEVLRPLPLLARIVVTAAIAVVGPGVLAFLLLTGAPWLVLLGFAAPVALVASRRAALRRQQRQDAH